MRALGACTCVATAMLLGCEGPTASPDLAAPTDLAAQTDFAAPVDAVLSDGPPGTVRLWLALTLAGDPILQDQPPHPF